MKNIIRLIRPTHWIKNILVLAALFFSSRLLEPEALVISFWGLLSFCTLSSAVYVLNDLKDAPADRKHPVKCRRPIASGAVAPGTAVCVCILLVVLTVLFHVLSGGSLPGGIILLLYLILNLLYSLKLKHVPLVDLAILVSGFLLRVVYGGLILDQPLSSWLLLTIISGAFYLVMGKRRNELAATGEKAAEVRGVLKYYNDRFLDKNMYVCLALTLMFYALWTVDDTVVARMGGNHMVWTVPLVLLIFFRYSLDVESGDFGDPVDVLVGDKWLIVLVLIYGLAMLGLLYSPVVFG